MARTWLITEDFPNFCPYFQPTRVKYVPLINHVEYPTSSWPTYSFPAPIASNQGMSDSFHSSAPLPDFESVSNIGDGGWIPCYSKLWIDNLCLFSFESESEVAQSCPTLCDPMDCSLSGSSVRGIFQARVLEWIAISFSRGYSRPRNRTLVSRIAGRRFTVWSSFIFTKPKSPSKINVLTCEKEN